MRTSVGPPTNSGSSGCLIFLPFLRLPVDFFPTDSWLLELITREATPVPPLDSLPSACSLAWVISSLLGGGSEGSWSDEGAGLPCEKPRDDGEQGAESEAAASDGVARVVDWLTRSSDEFTVKDWGLASLVTGVVSVLEGTVVDSSVFRVSGDGGLHKVCISGNVFIAAMSSVLGDVKHSDGALRTMFSTVLLDETGDSVDEVWVSTN